MKGSKKKKHAVKALKGRVEKAKTGEVKRSYAERKNFGIGQKIDQRRQSEDFYKRRPDPEATLAPARPPSKEETKKKKKKKPLPPVDPAIKQREQAEADAAWFEENARRNRIKQEQIAYAKTEQCERQLLRIETLGWTSRTFQAAAATGAPVVPVVPLPTITIATSATSEVDERRRQLREAQQRYSLQLVAASPSEQPAAVRRHRYCSCPCTQHGDWCAAGCRFE
jgi:hypothetical protein